MSNRLEEIGRRKRSLMERATTERDELVSAFDEIRAPFDLTRSLVGVGWLLKSHPIIAAGISSFLVSGYASKLLKSTGEVFKLWRLARPIWSWWKSKRRG